MSSEGIIAADATKNPFHEQHPNGISIISVAIAVEDHDAFNSEYFDILTNKIEKYDMKVPHPIIKHKYISRYIPLWNQDEARRDIVLDLLSIDSLDTIYITETYLDPQWIELYHEEESAHRREISYEFVENILFQYYDIVSIWKYLERYDGADGTHYNLMTDDFSGQLCKAYQEIGERCEDFVVVPSGDRTYPVLSLADLVTGLLKEEVYPLREAEIQDYMQDDTPAYVETESVHKEEDLEKIIPHKTDSFRTDLLYPDPTVYIYRGNMSKNRMKTLDIYDHACMYAQQQGGCVKQFEESNDHHHFSGNDLIICLDNSDSNYADYETLNSKYSAQVLNRTDGLEYLLDELPSDLVL